jgi:muramoyltetrapeptide carboxypeptidase
VRVGDHVLDRDPTYPFLAGSDADRAADLQRAWCDPEVAAVFVARGGSGATRLIDRLDWAAMRAAGPRLLVGFSDVTALSEAVATRLGLMSLFGPMPAAVALGEVPPDAASAEHLRRTLFEPDAARVVFDEGATTVVPGRARGVVVGGTVSVLTMALGTEESRPAAGGIAVLEDVAEAAFRLDNRLTQLLRTGWFDGVRGIVLGSWTDCGPDAEATVVARLRELGVPMVAGLPIGHCIPALTVPLGVEAVLDAGAGTLTMLSPALL